MLYNGAHYPAVWCYAGSRKDCFVIKRISEGSPEMIETLSLKNTVAFIKRLFIIREDVVTVSERREFIIYAHNMGGYDGIFILKALISMGKTNSNIMVRGDDIFSIEVEGWYSEIA
jgi:hypothetical protein